jgi:hypothetical protein
MQGANEPQRGSIPKPRVARSATLGTRIHHQTTPTGLRDYDGDDDFDTDTDANTDFDTDSDTDWL